MDSLYSQTSPCWSVYKGCVITPFVFPWCICPFLFLSVCPSNVCCVFTFDLVTELPLLCVCVYIYSVSFEKERSDEECFDADGAPTVICSPSVVMCCFSSPHTAAAFIELSSIEPLKDKAGYIFFLSTNLMCRAISPINRHTDRYLIYVSSSSAP